MDKEAVFTGYRGYDLAVMNPPEENGRICCDFSMADDDHLVIVMADREQSERIRTWFKEHACPDMPVSQLIRNEAVPLGAWIGILDDRSDLLTYVNAGDCRLITMTKEKTECLYPKEESAVQQLQISEGDRILLWGRSVNNDTLCESCIQERILECFRYVDPDLSCSGILEYIRKCLEDCDPDEMSILVMKHTNENKEIESMEKTFDAKDEKLHEVISFVEEELESRGADMKTIMAVSIALEEIFVNISHYAYPEKEGTATVRMSFEDDMLELSLTDSGIPFDPLEIEDPDIHADLKERDVGGLGIFMVKKYMDECHYERKDGQNIFTMKKVIRND